ncbi:hypothetical protein [Lysobacter gummosus]|uniref:hypothetical protein n=1 Tax=Lysobacter gummosus TaxID=262324 RepID=UPI00364172F0
MFAHFIRSRESGMGNRESEGGKGTESLCDSRFPIPDSRLHMPSNMRCGFSSWFLMSTRNSTASLPSMMRWS